MSKGNKHQVQYLVDCSSLYIFILGCPENSVSSKHTNIYNLIHETSCCECIQNNLGQAHSNQRDISFCMGHVQNCILTEEVDRAKLLPKKSCHRFGNFTSLVLWLQGGRRS